LTFFHFENLPVSHAIIQGILRVSGTYWRGYANAARVRLRHNEVFSDRLPAQFDGFIPRLCGNPEKTACQPRLRRFSFIHDPPWLPGQRIARRAD
jgi:hypothetical protein